MRGFMIRDEVERARRWAAVSQDGKEEAALFGYEDDPVVTGLYVKISDLMTELQEARKAVELADDLFEATDVFYEEYRIWELDPEEWTEFGEPYFNALSEYYRARKDVIDPDE